MKSCITIVLLVFILLIALELPVLAECRTIIVNGTVIIMCCDSRGNCILN